VNLGPFTNKNETYLLCEWLINGSTELRQLLLHLLYEFILIQQQTIDAVQLMLNAANIEFRVPYSQRYLVLGLKADKSRALV